MFQHVTVHVSFIFAIALTHVFSSASQLLLARDRVRFSALLAVAMLNAALGAIIDPVWDPIRSDPGFQQLLAGKEQIGPNK